MKNQDAERNKLHQRKLAARGVAAAPRDGNPGKTETLGENF